MILIYPIIDISSTKCVASIYNI